MQQVEDPVQVVNCEHFPDTCVMIEDYRRHSVAAANEIAHAGLGSTNEFCIAEDHPRFFRSGNEWLPKSHKHGGRRFGARFHHLSVTRQQPSDRDHSGHQEQGQANDRDRPPARSTSDAGFLCREIVGVLSMVLGRPVPGMERKQIGPLWHLHLNGVVNSLRSVVLGQLQAQSPCLYSDGGVQLRVEGSGTPEDLCGDLVFLEWSSRMIQRVLGQIAQQFPEGFRAMQGMAVRNLLDLGEVEAPFSLLYARYSHLT